MSSYVFWRLFYNQSDVITELKSNKRKKAGQSMKRNIDINEISDGKLYEINDLVKAECNDCKGCSDCCRGMGTSIILDPYDVYRLTGGLHMSFEQLLGGYAELNVVDGIILPNLKMNGKEESCMFLNEAGRCSIHSVRPGICRMFPLGRIYEKDSFRYFIQVNECSNKNRTKVKVKKWIDTPDTNKYEKYIMDWHNLLMDFEQKIAEHAEDNYFMKQINMLVLNTFYVRSYDVENDFYPQFYNRLSEIKGN